jgi:hypothetical protein
MSFASGENERFIRMERVLERETNEIRKYKYLSWSIRQFINEAAMELDQSKKKKAQKTFLVHVFGCGLGDLSGASVTVYSGPSLTGSIVATLITDSTGRASYTADADANPSFQSFRADVGTQNGSFNPATGEYEMNYPTPIASVFLTDGCGLNPSGWTVTIKQGVTTVGTGTTNASGTANIAVPGPASYTAQISRPNFATQTQSFTVTGCGTTFVPFNVEITAQNVPTCGGTPMPLSTGASLTYTHVFNIVGGGTSTKVWTLTFDASIKKFFGCLDFDPNFLGGTPQRIFAVYDPCSISTHVTLLAGKPTSTPCTAANATGAQLASSPSSTGPLTNVSCSPLKWQDGTPPNRILQA